MSDEDKSALAQILQMLSSMDHKLNAHMVAEEIRLEKIDTHIESIDGIVAAFPHDHEGIPDFRGHRRFHDDSIDSGKSWSSVVQSVKNKLAESLTVIVIGLLFIGYTTWQQGLTQEYHVAEVKKVADQQDKFETLLKDVSVIVSRNEESLKKNDLRR